MMLGTAIIISDRHKTLQLEGVGERVKVAAHGPLAPSPLSSAPVRLKTLLGVGVVEKGDVTAHNGYRCRGMLCVW